MVNVAQLNCLKYVRAGRKLDGMRAVQAFDILLAGSLRFDEFLSISLKIVKFVVFSDLDKR